MVNSLVKWKDTVRGEVAHSMGTYKHFNCKIVLVILSCSYESSLCDFWLNMCVMSTYQMLWLLSDFHYLPAIRNFWNLFGFLLGWFKMPSNPSYLPSIVGNLLEFGSLWDSLFTVCHVTTIWFISSFYSVYFCV